MNPKEKFVVEVNTQQLQKMKVKERVITPRQEFQEFKFQVRELSLRKSWNEALALINSYYGPFALESLALKAEIERRRTSALSPPKELISENNKKSLFEKLLTVKPTMASHSPQIRDNRKSLKIKEAINLIVKLKLKKAQEHIIQIEKELEVNLNFFEIILDKIDSPSLTKNIVNGYKTDFGQQLKLQLKQSTIKGMLLFLDSQSGELTLVVNNQNTIIHVHDIHYKENFKRINDADPEQEALLKTLYLLQNKDTQLARKVIQDEYQGPMKSHFEKVLKSLQQ
ncbi:MAG: hypothetical protein MK132_20280 [Lentisphaerales bacterium]|nr:hypothetical protein [Lentisphaerales bacterium]